MSRTLELIDRLCACFEECSTDDDHPAVRYGRQLEALRKKLAGLSDAAGTRSPTGGRTMPLPQAHSETPESRTPANGASDSAPHINGHNESQLPSWLQNVAGESNQFSPQWQLPVNDQGYTQPIVFPYPSAPVSGGGPQPNPGPTSYSSTFFFPPAHQQPLGEVGVIPPPEMNGGGQGDQNVNLGFATLDDWFGPGGIGSSETQNTIGQDGGVGAMGGLDLQDFWMKVGPGEAQGGFPFR
ncbi:hypothetical protein CI109_104236 [Kwoniella shandongensis]|uniref:Uncharacterized protein n=1 Tax=Kwoniella shandongensis TaxID=1734106 RepID=A0AAJ8LKY2_9TREE